MSEERGAIVLLRSPLGVFKIVVSSPSRVQVAIPTKTHFGEFLAAKTLLALH